jgi:integrase
MQRQVKDRKTKAGAEKLAKEIKGQLKRGEVGRVHRVTTDEQRLLELCRKLRDPHSLLKEALDKQDNFKRATVATCCDLYIAEYKDCDSSMTRNDATSKAGTIRETLGEHYLDSLTERDIEEWRDTKLTGSKRYRNNIHAHLRHLFERARVWGYIPKGHNPAKEVASIKIPRKEPVVWTPKVLKACLQWYGNSDKSDAGAKIVFLALGAFSGMRPSEIEGVVGERDGLHWDDIDFKQRHIRIRAEVAGKLAEPRYITFTEKPGSGLTKEVADSMWAALCKWIGPYRKSSGPVTFRKCQRLVSPELREAKLISSWPKDGLRHTWISSLLALGVHRDWVAELAGNSPGVIRTNYKRPIPEEVAKKWFSNCLA